MWATSLLWQASTVPHGRQTLSQRMIKILLLRWGWICVCWIQGTPAVGGPARPMSPGTSILTPRLHMQPRMQACAASHTPQTRSDSRHSLCRRLWCQSPRARQLVQVACPALLSAARPLRLSRSPEWCGSTLPRTTTVPSTDWHQAWRRGHTVCGGSGGGEGSSSNSVYPGGFVWLVVSPAIVLSLLIALRTSVVTRPSLQTNHVPRN